MYLKDEQLLIETLNLTDKLYLSKLTPRKEASHIAWSRTAPRGKVHVILDGCKQRSPQETINYIKKLFNIK